jgi:hypothetical protein
MPTHWLTRVYLACLALYPAAYREEYGEELAYAIRAAVADARANGWRALVGLAWRELRDLPPALLAAQLSQWEGRAMKLQVGVHLPDGPIRSYWLVALFVPFMIPLVMTLLPVVLGGNPLWLYTALVLMLGLATIATGVLGLAKGYPAWALPTLGALLFMVWSPLKWGAQGAILIALHPRGNYWPAAIPDKLAQQARLDVAFLAIAVLMAALLLLLSPPLWRRARRDWSSLSFLLYGMAIPYVILNDPYRGLEPYEAVSALLLAAGAALFVLAPKRWQRLLALVAALLLAHPLLSLGIYQIFHAQTFAGPDPSFRLWEAIQPVLELPVLVALVCLPALLALWPVRPGDGAPRIADPQGQI